MGSQMAKRIIEALKGEMGERPPFWLMRQAGRYLPEYRQVRSGASNFLEFCYTPDLAVEVTLQPLRRYDMDASIVFSDILVVCDALGCDVSFVEGLGPRLEPVRTVQDVAKLTMDRFEEHLQPVYEIIRRLSKEIPAETALIGFAGAPWTLAVYMVEGKGGTDCSTLRKWAYSDPEGFETLMSVLVNAVSFHLIKQIQSGAELVQIFDSWAGILSETQFKRWVIEPTRKIIENLRAACPGIPIIGFPRAAGVLYQDFVKETGVDGVSLDSGIPLQWAVDNLQSVCTVQGNLDNQALIAGGQALEGEMKRILDGFGKGPFIFNLGHGVLPGTPPENVARVAELVRTWRGS